MAGQPNFLSVFFLRSLEECAASLKRTTAGAFI
jgi:hypothetical protein